MPVVLFAQEDIDWAKNALKSSGKLVEFENKFKAGDVVQIARKGSKHDKKVGVIVRVTGSSYIVEPFNDPYSNNPDNRSKTGPWFDSDLEPARKPRGASLVYVPPEDNADTVPVSELLEELSVKPQTKAKAVSEKATKIKQAFSGSGNSLITKLKSPSTGSSKADLPPLSKKQKVKLNRLVELRGNGDIKRTELIEASRELYGIDNAFAWIQTYGANKVKWGVYSIKVLQKAAKQ